MFGFQTKDGNYIYGDVPKFNTVHGVVIDNNEYAYPHMDYPLETCLERAIRLGILDVWIPTLFIKMQGNTRLTIQGPRALSIWKTYSAKEFGNNKSKQQKGQHDTRRSKGKATKD